MLQAPTFDSNTETRTYTDNVVLYPLIEIIHGYVYVYQSAKVICVDSEFQLLHSEACHTYTLDTQTQILTHTYVHLVNPIR